MPNGGGPGEDPPWSDETPKKAPDFWGYERELRTALFLARSVLKMAIIFGYPGGGKSSVARRVAWDLRAENGGKAWPVLRIRCEKIRTMPEEEARERLAQISTVVSSRGNPQIVVLDELDGIAPEHSRRSLACWWVIDLVKDLKDHPRGVFLIAATNHPMRIDATIFSEMGRLLDIPPPEDDTLLPLLKEHLNQNKAAAKAILNAYRGLAKGRVIMTRPLHDALLEFGARVVGWKAWDAAKIAGSLHPLGVQDDIGRFNKWKEENALALQASSGLKALAQETAAKKAVPQ
ncbi:MAG: ATP-binding protein [Dehalococcoidia bacterium]